MLGSDNAVRGTCSIVGETHSQIRLKTYDRYGINDSGCVKTDPNKPERLFGKEDGSTFALYSVAYLGSIITHCQDNFHIVNSEKKTTQVKTRFYDVFADIFKQNMHYSL